MTADIGMELKHGIEAGEKKPGIENLPIETQEGIFKHSATNDLLALALVSKHFHDLASAQLYRVLEFSLVDMGDLDYISQTSRATSGLETLVASGHDYAKYIKELQLGAPGPDERTWRTPGDNFVSGRLLNTLLLLALKKARALETFQWNLRIELNRSVFRALHDIGGLQHLRIRLKAGPSTHIEPPPPPMSTITNSMSASNPSSMPWVFTVKVPKPSQPTKPLNATSTFSGFKSLSSLAVLDMDTLDPVPELAQCILSSACTLKSLELSISEAMALRARKPGAPQESDDESDPELDENDNPWAAPPPMPPPPAAATLGPLPPSSEADIRKERLAQENLLARIFGLENLSAEAQKMDKEMEPVTVKPREDAQKAFLKDLKTVMSKLIIATSSQNGSTFKPQKALDMVEKAAEKYLNATEKVESGSSKKTGKSLGHGGKKVSTKKTVPLFNKGSAMEHPPGAVASSSESPDVLINFDFDSFLDPSFKDSPYPGNDHKSKVNKPPMPAGHPSNMPPKISKQPSHFGQHSGNTMSNWTGPYHGENPEATTHVLSKGKAKLVYAAEPAISSKIVDEDEDESDSPGLFDTPADSVKASKRLQKEADDTDDIDIEHPDVNTLDEGDDQESDDSSGVESEMKVKNVSETEEPVEGPNSSRLTNGTTMSEHVPAKTTGNRPDSAIGPVTSVTNGPAADTAQLTTDQAMQDYVRSVHGLPLENLALYLIPIKPSVLSRAIDLTMLKSVTLLNVGPQGGFWSVMAKKHAETPLQLRYIHTDNVTPSFLSCVNSLSGLTQLYMLERSSKSKVESLAPNTVVGIEDIRQQVLIKHIRTLEKLMIKNENDNGHTWDLNGKATRLITTKGHNLTELAVSLDSRNSHLFMQNLSGLKSLSALHILHFRSDDTCIWVFRELRRFIVDNVAQHPHLPLEYLALKDSVSQLVQKVVILSTAATTEKQKKDSTSKQKVGASTKATTGTGTGAGTASAGGGGGGAVSGDDLTSDHDNDDVAAPGYSDDADDYDDGDEDDVFLANGLKIDTIDGYRFSDLPEVKIFSREIRLGKL